MYFDPNEYEEYRNQSYIDPKRKKSKAAWIGQIAFVAAALALIVWGIVEKFAR